MKKVAVVTVNYNTEEETKKLLKSLESVKTPDISLAIIVVDNGSDKVLDIPHDEHTTLIRLNENLGFTGGYNTGMTKALEDGAEYIVIVNNDCIVDADLVKELEQTLEEDTQLGVVVPKIYFAKGHEFHKERYKKEELGKVFWYAGGFMDWNNVQSIHRGVDEVDTGQYDTLEKVTFATGCCMMFRRETLQKVGLFNDQYFLYFEDADMGERIKKIGYKMAYVPTAILFHSNAVSSGGAGKGNALQDYFITRNRMLFGMRYAPLRTKIALLRESLRLKITGRPEQKRAIRDFYLGKFGKGTFFDN